MPSGRCYARIALLTVALSAWAGSAQDLPKPAKDKDAAVKLPDGTIVFYSKTPDDTNAPVEGVRLSAKEYRALVEQGEQLKKLKDGVKPVGPSECHVTGRVATRGDRSVAEIALAYRFRTTAERSVVILGGGRTFPTSAKIDDGALPVLVAADDGLSVLVEHAGEHALTLTVEAPVTARGFNGELGFDVGLPKAAITSLSFDSPYPANAKGKRVSVSVRGNDPNAKPGALRRTSHDPTALSREPVPLGAADLVEVTWDAPSAGGGSVPMALVVETDVAVRVEDTQIVTTAKVKLKGDTAREWAFVLPAGAVVGVDRTVAVKASDPAAGSRPEVTKPTEQSGTGRWLVELPDVADWTLTAVVRTPRPAAGTPGHTGPFPIGPVVVRNVLRQTGTVRIAGPSDVRLAYSYGSELRPTDPAAGDSAAFQFQTVPVATGDRFPPLLTLTAMPDPGVVLLKPQYRLRLTPAGWRIHADLHVTPIRTGITQFRVESPDNWPTVEFGPPEIAENAVTESTKPRRVTAIRFDTARHDPFDLTLDVTLPTSMGDRSAELALPAFLNVRVRESVVSVAVPPGIEMHGTVLQGAEQIGHPIELLPPTPGTPGKPAGNSLTATLTKAASRVILNWQPFRPPLAADLHADVTVQDRQIVVVETMDFHSADPVGRPLRLHGPVGAVGLRGQPILTPAGPGEWTVTPPADRAKDFALNLTYAVPIRPDAGTNIPVGLIWSEDATHTDAVAQVWSGMDRRLNGFDGPWRESQSVPSPTRASWPGLTLKATRGPDETPPDLAVALADSDTAPTRAMIDRGLVQVWFSADGESACRARFVLSHWPAAGVILDLPDSQVEIWLDGKRVEGLPPAAPADGYASAVRVPLPEPKFGRAIVVLDVRFVGAKSALRYAVLPPHVRAAASKNPPRWQVIPPPGTVALNLSGELAAETRWLWHGGRFLPAPVGTTAELDRWIQDGTEPTTSGDEAGLVGKQIDFGKSIRLVLLPMTAWSATCSVIVLIAGLTLARLKNGLGVVIIIIGVLSVAAYLGFPQPFGQLIAAAQPGLLAVAVVLIGQATVRGYYRRRITNLPGFSRIPVESPSGNSAGEPVAASALAGKSPT